MTLFELALLAFIASLGLSTGVLFTAFPAVTNMKRLYKDRLLWSVTPPAMKATAVFWGVIGVICDVYFNWTRGAWIFREAPWKSIGTFTSRVQRHLDHAPVGSRRRRVALEWAAIGNALDSGHFRMTPRSA